MLEEVDPSFGEKPQRREAKGGVEEQVLVASRRKIAIQALTVSALLAASVIAVVWGDRTSNTQILIYGLTFASLLWIALISVLLSLARPGRLIIGRDALVIAGVIRQRRIGWSDVEAFAVKKPKSPMITIQHVPTPLEGRRRAARAKEDTFAVGDFAMPAPEIAQLLNEARAGAAGSGSPAATAEAAQAEVVS